MPRDAVLASERTPPEPPLDPNTRRSKARTAAAGLPGNAGVPGCWSDGLPGWSAGLVFCRAGVLPGWWSAGLPGGCRAAGLVFCRAAGLVFCRAAGLLVCRAAGWLPDWCSDGLPDWCSDYVLELSVQRALYLLFSSDSLIGRGFHDCQKYAHASTGTGLTNMLKQ